MAESIAQRLATASDQTTVREIRPLLNTMLADLTALRASILLITAKLDGDSGVNLTNYASACDPAALTTTS